MKDRLDFLVSHFILCQFHIVAIKKEERKHPRIPVEKPE